MKIGLKLREISRYKKELLALLFLFIVIGSFCLPIFKNINCYLENDDWLEHMSYHRFLRDSLINYHQFPLWCPFLEEDTLFFHIHLSAFNPLAVNSLLFGELFGLKINIFLIYTICLIGMFCLTRYALRFTYPAVLFSTLSVTLDGWFPRRLKDGNYTEFWYFYIPLIFYIILKAETNKRYIIIAAMLLSFVLMSGSISYMTFCLFFCIFFIGELIFRTKKNVINMRRLVTFLLIIILSLCYGMIKLLPMVELLRVNSRIVGPQIFQGFYLEKTVNMIKCLFFECGYIKFILCMVAIIFIRRKIIVWIFLLAVCTLIALSIDSPISLSAFLSYLPVFKSIKNWYKYFDFYIIFTSAIISGELLTYISLNCKNNVKSIFLLFIFLVGIVPLYWNNIKLQYQIFTKPIPLVKKEADFYQVESIGLPRDTLRTFRSNHYLNLLRNVGTIDFYTELPMRQSAIPRYFIESAGAIILYSNPKQLLFGTRIQY